MLYYAVVVFLVFLALCTVPLILGWRAPAVRLQPIRPVGSGRTHPLV